MAANLIGNEKTAGTGRPMLSVVIPTYGRGSVLDQNVQQILEILRADDQYGASFEVILVDDGSPDNTAELIRRLCSCHPEVRGILLSVNCGQQNATLAGLRKSSGDFIMTMDDDLKDRPEDIRRLLDHLRGGKPGFDVVYGVPQCPPQALWYRRLGTTFKEWLIARLCHKPFGLQLTGFRAMNRETADRICLEARRHVYISATILQMPVRIGQMTIRGCPGTPTASGYSLVKLARLVFQLAVQYGNSPFLRVFKQTGSQYEILEDVA